MAPLFCLFLLLLVGCKPHKPKEFYSVAIDPTFFPIELEGKEIYVLAFTNDLLQEIAHFRNISITKVPKAWDNIVYALKQKQVHAIISGMDPILMNEKTFDFSNLFLQTGPVIVLRKNMKNIDIHRLKNGYIGVIPRSKAALYIETQPNLMAKYYDNNGQICSAIVESEINGGLVDSIPAISYVADLYNQNLLIKSEPMFDEGIRLVTLKDTNSDLLYEFNEGLKELKQNGVYQKLLKKWNLIN
ncbi:MAG: transporter substrate-binding domain-containing protein [Rhabdochlamydiaceae bacterium]|nr:transporter substrate-binding domain-containing protein [Candidatus Amphrikana amoebophyrae]